MSKYKNKKIILDGIKFDSIKEGKRYLYLKQLQQQDKIKELQLQKRFELQPSYKKNNKTIRKIEYICDFFYFDIINNKYIVEDVKSEFTKKDKVYRIKKKLFEYKYDLEINEI